MMLRFRAQRLTSFVLLLMLTAPLSALTENRPEPKTDLERTREELARILGTDRVSVEGSAEPVRSHGDVEAVLGLMNGARVHHGLPPLRLNAKLSQAATDRSRDMLDKGYFDHISPDGSKPFVWIDRRGYRYRTAGENLALGYPTVEHLISAWLESPAHRANLLGNFEEVGLAIVSASPVERSQGPLVVALYATAM
jgi:uncharacterized protein YkwD